MIICTDNKEFAETLITPQETWMQADPSTFPSNLQPLVEKICRKKAVYKTESSFENHYSFAFLARHSVFSHFDILVELSQRNPEWPSGIICLAGSGRKFHGQRGRPWQALEGNIHLSIFFAPHQEIEHFHSGFPILAAVSLIESLDSIIGLQGQAEIKWVNDILIHNAKVAGFLVHTSSIEKIVSTAILGIGLNVEKTPKIPLDPFVPRVGSLQDFIYTEAACTPKTVLEKLLNNIHKNYKRLCDGKYFPLLDIYRKRSLIVGRHVQVLSDSSEGFPREIASGKVEKIGDNLELFLEGRKDPVTKGRLLLKN